MTEDLGIGRCRVRRSATWSEHGDVVVVDCPKPTAVGLCTLGAWFRWWTGPQRIRLDALGSAAWRRFDGSVTVDEIADSLAGAATGDARAIDCRLELFVRALHARGLIYLVVEDWERGP